MPKVFNRKTDLIPLGNSVYVGRPSPWGNPFVIGRDGTRDEVIQLYANKIESEPELLELIQSELRGKDLVCWCAPEPCHGDVLLHYANLT